MRPVYTRPVYETQKDRDNELRVKARIEQWGECELVKSPPFKGWDFTAHRDGKLVALFELKKRTNTREKYSTYMISGRKWTNLCEDAKRLAVPAILVVEWTNFLGWVCVNPAFPVTWGTGGRFDRGDQQDVESVVYIDTNKFRSVV